MADIHTPEQFQPREWVTVDGNPVYRETCQTFSGSWGYHRDESTWKSPEQFHPHADQQRELRRQPAHERGPDRGGCSTSRAGGPAVYRD